MERVGIRHDLKAEVLDFLDVTSPFLPPSPLFPPHWSLPPHSTTSQAMRTLQKIILDGILSMSRCVLRVAWK
jgi:hypothetical protein